MLIANVSPRTGGKTTNTAWFAHALTEAEYEVEGFDADHSKQFWDWQRTGKFSFPVHLAANARFHEEVQLPEGKVSVVDCGHSENHPHITDSVLRVADVAIMHMSPTRADWLRVTKPPDALPFMDIVKRTAVFREDGKPTPTWVLLNRCPTKTNVGVTKHYRERLEAKGWNVLTTTILSHQTYGQSMGFPITGAKATQYGELVTELEDRGLLCR